MNDQKSNDPLEGKTLEFIVKTLVDRYTWDGLGQRIDIRCFTNDPSIKSSLKFLRKTPWARAKVEALFIEPFDRQSNNKAIDNKRADHSKGQQRKIQSSQPKREPSKSYQSGANGDEKKHTVRKDSDRNEDRQRRKEIEQNDRVIRPEDVWKKNK